MNNNNQLNQDLDSSRKHASFLPDINNPKSQMTDKSNLTKSQSLKGIEQDLPKPLLDHLRQTTTENLSLGKASQLLTSLESHVKQDRLTLTSMPSIYKNNMHSISLSSIEENTRFKSQIMAHDKFKDSVLKERSIMANQSSRDISYFHEKNLRPTQNELDQVFVRDFFADPDTAYVLPTELDQLEDYFKQHYLDEKSKSIYKNLMKPNQEKEKVKQWENQRRNVNLDLKLDEGSEWQNAEDILTPRVSQGGVSKQFKVSFTEQSSIKPTQPHSSGMSTDHSAVKLRNGIPSVINEDIELDSGRDSQKTQEQKGQVPQDITKEMYKVDENMDLLKINDHLNRKQYDLNQTNINMTSPRDLLNSHSESSIHNLNAFHTFLDKKREKKGSQVNIFSHKIPEQLKNDKNVIDSNQNRRESDSSMHIIDKTLITESKINQEISYTTQTRINVDSNLGEPSRRKDAERLNEWLEFMLEKQVRNPEVSKFSDDFRSKAAQLVQSICLKELIRQVSCSCLERGLLLDKIWNSNITLFTVAEEAQQQECGRIKTEFEKNMEQAEECFQKELGNLREKVEAVKHNVADKDFTIMKKQQRVDQLTEDLEQEKKKTSHLNAEINRIVNTFTMTGKLPVEYMGEATRKAQEDAKQEQEDAVRKAEEEKQKAQEEEQEAEAQRELFKDIEGPKIARRKLLLPDKELNELDLKCREMTLEELIFIMDDPEADDALKRAALRAMVDMFGVEVLEDEKGNKILIDRDGNPLLNANGKPLLLSADFLKEMGAKLGKPEKMTGDLDKLKLLSKMVLGKSAKEAEEMVKSDLMGDKMGDFLANAEVEIDDEDGPLPGTRNKGLCTIQVPTELLNADMQDEAKTWVDNVHQELLQALAAQYLYENEEPAKLIADFTYKKFGKEEDFIDVEEEIEEEFIDEWDERQVEKRTVKKRVQKIDQLEQLREQLVNNGQPLSLALESQDPNANDPDADDAEEVYQETLEDGTRVKVIKTKDGRTIKKILTEEEARLLNLKEANELVEDFGQEQEALKKAEQELSKDKEDLANLQAARDQLAQKETFQIPGVSGKLCRRILDPQGEERYVTLDFENEDIDEHMSIQEETQEEGLLKYVKLTAERIKELMEYKQGYLDREKERLEKLSFINKEINDKVNKIKDKEKSVADKKQELQQKQQDQKDLMDAARKGQLDPTNLQTKVIKDGVTTKVDKDGKVHYYDKDGNEISEADAQETKKKNPKDIKDELNNNNKGGTVVDPKTGKRVSVSGKAPGGNEEVVTDPKTGKKIIKRVVDGGDEEEVVVVKKGKKTTKKVEQVEEEDEQGNTRRTKKGGPKKKTHFNKDDFDAEEEDLLDEFGNRRKVLKKVLNDKGKAKKDTLDSAYAKRKADGKFRQVDEHGNVVVSDKEPSTMKNLEKPPQTTFMVTNRLSKVQNEINILEDRKHYQFVRDPAEQTCRQEMEKLCLLFDNILGRSKNKLKKPEEDPEAKSKAVPHHSQPAHSPRVQPEGQNEQGRESKQKAAREEEEEAWKEMPRVDLDHPLQQITEFDEFNIGRRERKTRPPHQVFRFIESMHKLVNDTKFVAKLMMPRKKLMSLLTSTYEDQLATDLNLKQCPIEFIQDSYLKKQGLQKLAENKLKDFLVSCMSLKNQSKRCSDFIELFTLGSNPVGVDEQQVVLETQKYLRQYALKTNRVDVDDQLDKWDIKVITALSAFESVWGGLVSINCLDSLKDYIILSSEYDASQATEFLGTSEIGFAFKTKFSSFISQFMIPLYREIKNSILENIEELCRQKKIGLPDQMDKNRFLMAIQGLFNDPNGEILQARQRNEAELVSLDLFLQIVVKHNLLQRPVQDESRRAMLTESLLNFLVNVQSSDELLANTFVGYLRTLGKTELARLLTDSSLQSFSDLMFDKFDSEKKGTLDLDEFVNLCAWVDPKWDKIKCIKQFQEIDTDRSRKTDKKEFWAFSKSIFSIIIKDNLAKKAY